MPTYQYACTACGHRFEAVQAFTDNSLTVCPECGGQLRKVYGSVGVVFKGSGFYRTDSRAAAATTAPANGADKPAGGDKAGDKGGEKKVAATADTASGSKPAAAAASSGSSSSGSGSSGTSSSSGSGSSGSSSSSGGKSNPG